MEKERNTPSIRFKGFTDPWEQRKLGDVAEFNPQGTLPDEFEYVDLESVVGTEMIYHRKESKRTAPSRAQRLARQGDLFYQMVRPYQKNNYLFEKPDKDYVFSTGYAQLRPYVDGYFLLGLVQSDRFVKVVLDNCTGTSYPAINSNCLEAIRISCPVSKDEQQQVGTCFKKIDTFITLHQLEHEKLLAIKKCLMERMFPKNGEKVPEIRFKGFTDDWEQQKLNNLCELITKQTGFDYSATIKPSLVREKKTGVYPFIQNKDFSGNNINLDTDFYIPIEVAEKFPRILLDKPSLLISISGRIGNVGLYNLPQKSFIGGAVGICKLKDHDVGEFVVQELESEYGQRYFQSLIKASSHANITVEDIRNIELNMPSTRNERQKISDFFLNLDILITLHQRKLESLKELKKGLLQKMFV